jgi:hypothetical protein
MSVLLHASSLIKNFSKKEGIKMKLTLIGEIAVIAVFVTVTVLGFSGINPEPVAGMVG